MPRTRIRSWQAVATLCALALAARPATGAPAPQADMIMTGGYVYTVDPAHDVGQAIAVRRGRIMAVGTDGDIAKLAGPTTMHVDLRGHMVMPGLVDGHMHPLDGGRLLIGCSLHYAALTVDQFSTAVAACLHDPGIPKPGGWLVVNGWFQEAMQPKGTRLTRAVLDRIDPAHPIAVHSTFGHSALLNSAALRAAGIGARTPSPPGGDIVHDAHGEPTGILEDTAIDRATMAEPAPSADDDRHAAAAALALMRAQGVTGFLDALATEQDLRAFTAVQKTGGLTARGHFAPLIAPKDGPDVARSVARIKALALAFDQGPLVPAPGITVRNAKMFMDGVISAPSNTGRLMEPYRVNKGSAAAPRWTPGTWLGPNPYFPPAILAPLLIGLVDAGIDPHLHADGDGAVHIALDAIDAARKARPHVAFRPAIAHDELVQDSDMPRFGPLGAIPVLSFQWEKRAPDTIEALRDTLGPDRAAGAEPASRLERAGARIAYGSDWPVDPFNEWFALKVGITRQNAPEAGARYAAPLGHEPGLSRRTALRAITANSSYELESDRETGSLEPGKFADLIILDRNVLTVPAADIAQTKVLLTMVGGRIVYSTGAFAPEQH